MKIYNSMTNKKEEFVSLEKNIVKMYVCGPTVYDHAHIGNARPIVVFDTLKRVLEAVGYQVFYVSNYTDVDDKIINKAIENNCTEQDITKKYIKAYNEVRILLNSDSVDKTPRVTDNMVEIVRFIDELVSLGYAYEVDGDVYFRIDNIKDYGQLSKQNIEELIKGVRIEENTLKENPLDFTLWKRTDVGINWNSPWSQGRPGWHTECVVMINKEFGGGKIDIHGGGVDLRFPHHENERAQALAAYNGEIANYWVHNGMISFDDEKMSKSLGNVKLARDVVKEYGSNVTRWFILSSHYRDTLKFTDSVFEQAKKEIDKIEMAITQTDVYLQVNGFVQTTEFENELYKEFLEEMADDLNTPNAYTVISKQVKFLNQLLRVSNKDVEVLINNRNSLLKMMDVLGIVINRVNLSVEDIEIYNNWNKAKTDKDFILADELRNILIERGIV